MNVTSNATGSGVLIILIYIIYLGFTGIGIYCLVLLIKLATRGIKALDIYIEKNKERQ